MVKKHFYLIHIQYLGFRYHGWAKQPGLKTVHHMIDRTIKYVLEETPFKTLGTSRTDAMVSANHSAFELFLEKPLANENAFLTEFNNNLPQDIRAISIQKVDEKFNIINNAKIKTYEYLFCFGPKPHPFSASMMTHFRDQLDIALMEKGAAAFEGRHHLANFCKRPNENTVFDRDILVAKLALNTKYTASFFPETSYIFTVKARGFMRNQVRLMMGQLIGLGQGDITYPQFLESLKTPGAYKLNFVAPASGLMLHEIDFEE